MIPFDCNAVVYIVCTASNKKTADSEFLPCTVLPQGNSQATGKPNKRWQSQGQDHFLLRQDGWLALLDSVSGDLSESIPPAHHCLRPQYDNSSWSAIGLYGTTTFMLHVYQKVISVSIYLITIKKIYLIILQQRTWEFLYLTIFVPFLTYLKTYRVCAMGEHKAGAKIGGDLSILKTYSSMKAEQLEFGHNTSYITTDLDMWLPDSDYLVQSCTFSFEDSWGFSAISSWTKSPLLQSKTNIQYQCLENCGTVFQVLLFTIFLSYNQLLSSSQD